MHVRVYACMWLQGEYLALYIFKANKARKTTVGCFFPNVINFSSEFITAHYAMCLPSHLKMDFCVHFWKPRLLFCGRVCIVKCVIRRGKINSLIKPTLMKKKIFPLLLFLSFLFWENQTRRDSNTTARKLSVTKNRRYYNRLHEQKKKNLITDINTNKGLKLNLKEKLFRAFEMIMKHENAFFLPLF